MFRSVEDHLQVPMTLEYITLHETNYSFCGPEDGLQLTETCHPLNFVTNALGNVLCLIVYNRSLLREFLLLLLVRAQGIYPRCTSACRLIVLP
jgi:hypothetical protein